MFPAFKIMTMCALAAVLPGAVFAQSPTPASSMTGVSPHAVQLDAQQRPITAGGFVKSGPIVFEDIQEKAGLTKWTHKMGTPEKKYIIETKGSAWA